MSDSDPKNVRSWSGPINNLAEDERRSLVDSMSAEPRPRIAIAEALRNHWFEIWYQPKIDLKRKCLAGAEALARIRHPQLGVLLPGSFLPDVDEDSVAELAQHALVATLCDWTMFEEAGFNLHLAINVPVGVLLKLPIAKLVARVSSAIRALARAHCRSDRGPDRSRHRAGARDRHSAAGERDQDRDRRFRRRLFVVFELTRIAVRGAQESIALSSWAARPTPPMPRSARPRSISPIASAAPRWPKASRRRRICRP